MRLGPRVCVSVTLLLLFALLQRQIRMALSVQEPGDKRAGSHPTVKGGRKEERKREREASLINGGGPVKITNGRAYIFTNLGETARESGRAYTLRIA